MVDSTTTNPRRLAKSKPRAVSVSAGGGGYVVQKRLDTHWRRIGQRRIVRVSWRTVRSADDHLAGLLGHTTIDGRPFYVRQMKNMKASMPVQFMTGEPFEFWAFACGSLLARAHARSGDAARIAGYCGEDDGLDRALVQFAESYGDQTERDHAELVRAIKNGRVRATAGDEE